MENKSVFKIKRPFYKQPVILIIGGIIAVCVIAFVTFWLLSSRKQEAVVAHTAPATTRTSSPATDQSGTVTEGTDNSSLDADLSGLDRSSSNENSDMTTADSSINDQQKQIAVPTN
jgi:FtsZ-interacting cell division protein ZipA